MDTIKILLSNPRSLAGIGVTVALSAIFGKMIAHRVHRSITLTILALASLTMIIFLTLAPVRHGWSFGKRQWGADDFPLRTCLHSLTALRQASVVSGAEGVFNVLLFIPAGLFLTILVRKTIAVLFLLVLFSASIELLQAEFGARLCAGSDLFANSMGAGFGCVLGLTGSLLHASHTKQKLG